MKKIKCFLIFSFAGMLISCSGYTNHRVINVGTDKLTEVTVFSSGHSFNHGNLISKSEKGYSGSFVIGKEVVLRWILNDKEYCKKIKLENILQVSGEINFLLDGHNVKVEY